MSYLSTAAISTITRSKGDQDATDANRLSDDGAGRVGLEMKLVIGNALFGLVIWAWYYLAYPCPQFVFGIGCIFVAMVSGLGIGYWLNSPKRKARKASARRQAAFAPQSFDVIDDE